MGSSSSNGEAPPAWFFSYARSDSEFTLAVAKDLRAAGANVWIDQLDIVPGERWDRTVEAALRRCGGVIVVLSPASVGSDNVMDEVSYALEARKPVVPVLLAECDVPLRLRRLQHIDVRGGRAAALATLRQVLAERAGPASAPAPATAPPPRDEPMPAAGAVQPRHAARLPTRWWVGLAGVLAAAALVALFAGQRASDDSARARGDLAALQRKVDVAETVRKAEAGDAAAQYELAQLYDSGRDGMPRDVPKAAALYIRVVQKSPHPVALLALASTYMHGAGGIEKDLVAALTWSYLNGDHHDDKAQAYTDVRTLESRLSPQQIAEAKARAEAWTQKHYRAGASK